MATLTAALLLLATSALGVADPFHPPPEAAQRENTEGFKLYRKRDYAAARRRFARALELWPDYDAARYNRATTYAAVADWTHALEEVDALLSHNFPQYARQLLGDPDWAPIRVAAGAKELFKAKIEEGRARYAAGLERCLFFVARLRPVLESVSGDEVRIFRHQEIYALEVDSGRYRQVTDTGGRVAAFVVAPSGGKLAFLTAERLKVGIDSKAARRFVEAVVREIETKTLGEGEPHRVAAETEVITLGYGAAGLEISTAMPSQAALGETATVRATGSAITLLPKPAFEPRGRIAAGSLSLSPSGKHALFRRPCGTDELLLYDIEKKREKRIARRAGALDTRWIDEERFLFAAGYGEAAKVYLWSGGHERALPVPRGAGLRAIPEVSACGR